MLLKNNFKYIFFFLLLISCNRNREQNVYYGVWVIHDMVYLGNNLTHRDGTTDSNYFLMIGRDNTLKIDNFPYGDIYADYIVYKNDKQHLKIANSNFSQFEGDYLTTIDTIFDSPSIYSLKLTAKSNKVRFVAFKNNQKNH